MLLCVVVLMLTFFYAFFVLDFLVCVCDFSSSCRDMILIVTSGKFEYLGALERKMGKKYLVFGEEN